MRKVFDILLIATILVGVAYACSSDYMEPYEEGLVYNAYDPREELILITDSIPLVSSVEKLTRGENWEYTNQKYLGGVMQNYNMYDGSCYITMSVSVLVTIDSLGFLMYPSYYQEIQGYPVTVDVTIPDKVGSGVSWTYHSSRATISSTKQSVRVEVRGTFHDYMGFFKKDTYQNVTVHESKSIGL